MHRRLSVGIHKEIVDSEWRQNTRIDVVQVGHWIVFEPWWIHQARTNIVIIRIVGTRTRISLDHFVAYVRCIETGVVVVTC
jgi:hypothetical protein